MSANLAPEAGMDSTTSELPTLKGERIWGFWSFTSVNVGLAIATWAFLGGGTIALFVGAQTAIAATVIGNLIGVILVAVTTCLPSAKYGLEQYTALRSVFGLVGVRILVLVLFTLAAAGWNGILAIMFGRATANIVNGTTGAEHPDNGVLVIGAAILAIVVSWILLVKGPVSIGWVNKIVAPGLAIMTVAMLVVLLTNNSWADLMAAEPLMPFESADVNWVIAIELGLGLGFSWWTIVGNLARITKTQRAAFWPNLIGLFLASCVAGVVGTLAALTLGDSDPTTWMIPLGGVVLGVLGLVFVGFANLTSMVAQTYSGSLAIRRALGSAGRKVSWPVLTAALFAPALLVVFFPNVLYDNFFIFVAYVALVMSSLCAVYFTDYYLLRRRTLHLRDMYEPEGVSRYSFWGGVNPSAYLAVLAGAVTYYLLLDPYTLVSAPLFQFTTASLPAFVVTGAVHYALTKLWIIPAGKGGYTDKATGAGAATAGRSTRVR